MLDITALIMMDELYWLKKIHFYQIIKLAVWLGGWFVIWIIYLTIHYFTSFYMIILTFLHTNKINRHTDIITENYTTHISNSWFYLVKTATLGVLDVVFKWLIMIGSLLLYCLSLFWSLRVVVCNHIVVV